MDILQPKVIHFTPQVEQLLPFAELKCSVDNCSSIFTNSSNLMMHLQKHHKIPIPPKEQCATEVKLFYCPTSGCVYNVYCINGGKHFKSLKSVRQHFQKVHAIKQHHCNRCDKKFGTQGLLKTHQERFCGRRLECLQCGWQFEQRDALWMHCKRKGHELNVENVINDKKVAIPRLKRKVIKERRIMKHQQTQTDEKPLQVAVAQTDEMYLRLSEFSSVDYDAIEANHYATTLTDSHHVDDFAALLCDIETQTEIPCSSTANNNNAILLDQMLAHSSHMHTQTCDDFLSVFALADTQTQTNWSSLESEVSNKTAIAAHAHDELLVTTETQTSFAQCLLDSSNESAFSGPCNTQYTQTCGTLLDGLFGAQGTDIMSTFQSAYTQT